MTRILVTGNLGYVGPVFTSYLKAHDSDTHVTGFDAGFFAKNLTCPDDSVEARPDVQLFGDVRKLESLDLGNYDAVVCLSALSNDPLGNEFASLTDDINRQSALNLFDKCVTAGVRNFVFASSCSVYGAGGDVAKNEDDATNPLTAYAKSKIEFEADVANRDHGDMVFTSLRFATACGWSPRLRLDLVLNDFVASALLHGKIEILSDGSPLRPLISVNDMAKALHWSATRLPDRGGQSLVVNAGASKNNFTIRKLAKLVGETIGNCEISINTDAQPDKRSYRVDFSRFENLVGNSFEFEDMTVTISELGRGISGWGMVEPDFRKSNLIRLHALRLLKSHGLVDDNLFWASKS